MLWHLFPVAIYLLFPKRLGYFLWYVSPANAANDEKFSWSQALHQYSEWLIQDYHSGLWVFVLVLGLVALGLLTCRKMRPGSAAIICFLLLSIGLTGSHPNRKSRFVHSWLAAGWVLAGAGLTQILHGRAGSSTRRLANFAGCAAVGGLGVALLPGMLQPHQVHDGGPNLHQEPNLLLTDCYLPELKECRKTLILSNSAIQFLSQWTYLERYRRLKGVDTDIKGMGHDIESNRSLFNDWMASHSYDAVVFLDIPADSYFFEAAEHPSYEHVLAFLKEQSRFSLTRRWDFPQFGCALTLWTPSRQPVSGLLPSLHAP